MSQIRLFVPVDLEQDALSNSEDLIGHSFGSTTPRLALTTFVVTDHNRRFAICDTIATKTFSPGNPACICRLCVSEGYRASAPSSPLLEKKKSAQLEEAVASCDTCQVICYERPSYGAWHYATINRKSALSAALQLINQLTCAAQSIPASAGLVQNTVADSIPSEEFNGHGSMLVAEVKRWSWLRTGLPATSANYHQSQYSCLLDDTVDLSRMW